MTEIKTRTKTAKAFPARVSTFKALFEGASTFQGSVLRRASAFTGKASAFTALF